LSAGDKRATWLPTRGFVQPVAVGFTASALLLFFGGLCLYFIQTAQGRALPFVSLLPPIAIIVVFACIFPLFSLLRRPFGVELKSDGIRIKYPLKEVSFGWSDLMKIRSVAQGIVVFRSLSDPRTEFGGACWISREQARAILSDRRCPAVVMSDEFRRVIFGP
jgi:hypothetical protein